MVWENVEQIQGGRTHTRSCRPLRLITVSDHYIPPTAAQRYITLHNIFIDHYIPPPPNITLHYARYSLTITTHTLHYTLEDFPTSFAFSILYFKLHAWFPRKRNPCCCCCFCFYCCCFCCCIKWMQGTGAHCAGASSANCSVMLWAKRWVGVGRSGGGEPSEWNPPQRIWHKAPPPRHDTANFLQCHHCQRCPQYHHQCHTAEGDGNHVGFWVLERKPSISI